MTLDTIAGLQQNACGDQEAETESLVQSCWFEQSYCRSSEIFKRIVKWIASDSF